MRGAREFGLLFCWFAVLASVGAAGAVGARGSAEVRIQAGPDDLETPVELSKAERELIELVNAERAKEKLPPLKPNVKLLAAARGHALNMARQNKAAHVLDDKSPVDRVKEAGYAYRLIGENWAYGQKTNAAAMKQWMESPPHRANILKKEYTEIGVGIAHNGKGVPYYCQLFGTPLR